MAAGRIAGALVKGNDLQELIERKPRTSSMVRITGRERAVANHISTSFGYRVMGDSVGQSPNACPPFTNTCISAETPAFLSAA